MVDHHRCSRVMSRAEGHARIDGDVVFAMREILMKTAVDDASVADDDRLEVIAFPLFVPVASGDELVGERDTARDGHLVGCLPGAVCIEEIGRDVGRQSGIICLKRFKADICQLRGKQVGDVGIAGCAFGPQGYIVVHVVISFYLLRILRVCARSGRGRSPSWHSRDN